MGLIKLNQGTGLIRLIRAIKLRQVERYSIMKDGKTINHVKYIWGLNSKFVAED